MEASKARNKHKEKHRRSEAASPVTTPRFHELGKEGKRGIASPRVDPGLQT